MSIQPLPATDSAAELHELIGDDVTATFESDPTFLDSNPTDTASSENLEEQRPGAGKEFQAEDLKAASRGAGPDSDEDEEYANDEDEDYDDEDDEDEDDDLEDDDEDEDDYEDDDEDDYEDDDEDEDEDDEDEDEELDASAASSSGSPSQMMWADGLLGYEDEADDTANKVDRVTGDVQRERAEARKLSYDPDENPEDASAEVNPVAERDEQEDSNITIRPVKPVMDLGAMHRTAFSPLHTTR